MAKRRTLGSQAAYAVHRGVSREAVRKAVRAGRIHLVNGKVDFEAADRSWRENTDPLKPSNSVTGNPGGGARRRPEGSPEAGTLAEAVAVRAVWKAKRERLAYEREAGLVVAKADVELAWYNGLRRIRERLEQLAERVPREARMTVKAEVQRLLEELSGDSPGKPQPRRRAVRSHPARGASA